jgi:hypothetical protein
MIRWKGLSHYVLAFAAVALAFPFSGVARAEDATMVDKIVQMNKSALEDFQSQDWDSAKETLLAALVAGKRSGLEAHPIMARTYVHLGVVYLTGLKDRKKGLQSFARALEIDPTIKLSKAMSTPELEDALAEAGKQVKPRAGAEASAGEAPATPPPPPPPKRRGPAMVDENATPAPTPTASVPKKRPIMNTEDETAEPDVPAHVTALDCPTPDDVPPDKAVKLRCVVASNLSVAKVVLLYRQPGSEEFGEAEMALTPKGWYEGKIPKKAVTGKSIQFYFEGRNAAGKALVSNGRSDSPNLILLREKKAAEEAEADAAESSGGADTEENPLDERDATQGPKLYLGKVDKSRIGVDARYGNRRFWIGLGLGSGYGYAKGNGLEIRHDLNVNPGYEAGAGWAGLGHLAPELGFQVTPDFAISIEGRNQWIPQSGKFGKFAYGGAQSVMARLLFFTKQSQLRFFGSVMGGGGQGFRFVLCPDEKIPDFKDTVRGGPYLAGVGGGLNYEMSHSMSLVLEVNGLAGFPIFSMVVDVNAGIQVNLY